MKKKIIITGALGYIGSELCKIYSGESWHHKIIAIDNNFYSDRVSQLTQWNIEFYQGSILDVQFLKRYITDADIVHHLAGITNVAYTKSDLNIERDNLIKKTALEGTNNILNLMKKDGKIIFPSSHVVFDGLKKSKKNINEKFEKCPSLAYSESKSKNENDIINSGVNYIILRLASVYGFSNDSTRIQIVPNLFSKIASENGTIKLFAKGVQLKSLVALKDVARCFKFMEEKLKIKNEIFNLSNENLTVKKIALSCKSINSKLKILETNDEIPNKGYTLNNSKLKKTGFKFLYNLKKSLEEMISNWKNKKKVEHLEYKEQGQNEFIDFRGKISNYNLTEPINLIGLITSKKNTVRANHFHPIQEQKCLVTEGCFISVFKDLLSEDNKIITQVINSGEITVTKPNVAHAMIFVENTTFLNLVRGEREHKNYGITHTIPHLLVDEKLKKKLLLGYKFKCRVCGNKKLKRVLSFGLMPLANNLENKINVDSEKYPLELNYCNECSNCQLSYVVNPKKLFVNYLYTSSTAKALVEHFDRAAIKYKKKLNLNKKSYIVDIGSNDGIALRSFLKLGFKNIHGIEPAKNLADIANKNNIRTINSFFNKKIINKLPKKVDLILASNVFAHSDEIDEITSTIKSILKTNGTFIIEIQYLVDTLKYITFDNIYHEHVNYWCLNSLKKYFENFNLKIFDVEKINTHGGSLRIYVTKKNNKIKVNRNVNILLQKEVNFGIFKFKTFELFAKKIENIKNNTIKNLINLNNNYNKIYAFGAPAKATTMINYFKISNFFKGVIEDNKLKQNKFLPGTNLKIYNKNKIKDEIDCLIVFAWNYYNDIKKNNKTIAKKIISIKDLER
jgi:nucleoside-diphosphate-sugar epimerase/SAM-dependent methyltransferase